MAVYISGDAKQFPYPDTQNGAAAGFQKKPTKPGSLFGVWGEMLR